MGYRVVKILIEKSLNDQMSELLKDPLIVDHWQVEEDKDRISHELLVKTDNTGVLTDKVQTFFGAEHTEDFIGLETQKPARIIVTPVLATWPQETKEQDNTPKKRKFFGGLSREELYNEIQKGTNLDFNFFALVVLSAVVAAIGLLEDNLAVIIGAMVIAPLLGPNLALALATALADKDLMVKAIITNIAGASLAIALGALIGQIWPYDLKSAEVMARTYVGYDGIILAVASGAAGVLSLTAGVSSVLVGVMVAVALLPPAVTFGMMLGAGETSLAMGAAILLAVNVVCVNLSAKLIFLLKGVQPRTWYEQKRAKKAMFLYIAFWLMSLSVLAVLIHLSFK